MIMEPAPEQSGTLKDRVVMALTTCRPFLQKDEGDVELVQISSDGIVELRFLGTCAICPMSPLTLRAGLERAIMHVAAEVKRVEAVK